MSHFAEIDKNNLVTRVLVGDPNLTDEQALESLENSLEGVWVQTSYNAVTNGFRKNYAGIGSIWDGVGFHAPQYYNSWTLNTDSYLWEAPTPMPTDDKMYSWNEDTLSWVEITM